MWNIKGKHIHIQISNENREWIKVIQRIQGKSFTMREYRSLSKQNTNVEKTKFFELHKINISSFQFNCYSRTIFFFTFFIRLLFGWYSSESIHFTNLNLPNFFHHIFISNVWLVFQINANGIKWSYLEK